MPQYKRSCNLSKRSLRRRVNESIANSSATTSHETNEVSLAIESAETIEYESDLSDVSDIEYVLSDLSDIQYDDVEVAIAQESPNEFLARWKHEFNVNNNAVNSLLRYLQSTVFPFLPKDSRTLLQTPTSRDVISIDPGTYVHIGMQTALDIILNNVPEDVCTIFFDINIDGLPISRSSTSGFWLILGKVYNLPNQPIFVIGVYHGYNKPANFSDFLRPHVDELKKLMDSYIFKGRILNLKIRSYICDAPARASVTGTKGHNARFGCNKCCQEGVFIKNRMTFPECNATLRTDQSFRNKSDENYHKFTTPIEELNIDMVNSFPFDYLHVVCLGVMKKMIRMWLSGDTRSLMPSSVINQISDRLKIISKTQPTCFQRSIRPLSDFGYFKGSELRTFILYAGPFALKDAIPFDMYENFLLLHVAISILCNKETYLIHSDLAQRLLERFVEEFSEIYGEHHIIYNVHCLTHLVSDTKQFGCLDDYSAFKFESYMYQVKRLLHKNNQPLAEICNRIHEMNSCGYSKIPTPLSTVKCILKKKSTISKNGNATVVYNEIVLGNLRINNSIKDEWFLTNSKEIVRFKHLELINNKKYVCGTEIRNKKDFYVVPIKSSYFDIFETDGIESQSEKLWRVDSIYKKLFAMNQGENIVFFPLSHSN